MNYCVREIISWLIDSIKLIRVSLMKAFIFGSVARKSINPNDCDLAIVMLPDCDRDQKRFVRDCIDRIKDNFFIHFNLALSVVVLTSEEWIEFQDFFGFSRIVILA